MRIGLFSDMYLPSVNGISFVLQITHRQLTALGHEVYIFAPASNLRGKEADDPPYVYRFPAVEGVFFDEQLTSVFFPPVAYQKIHKLRLDVVHFFTPGQIGLQGVYCAMKDDIPLISQYSTDLYRYVERYPKVLPATLSLPFILPFVLRLTPRETIKVFSAFKPKRGLTKWHKDLVVRLHTIVHNRCDAVIALSPKMKKQLDTWGSSTTTTLLPSGVDPLPTTTASRATAFKNSHNIAKDSIVFLYAGRVSREKNLDLLIDAFNLLPKTMSAKLVLAGSMHSQKLVAKARASKRSNDIIFSGKYIRDKANVIYAAADVFLFPSLTDTQGLVVHEAAGANLPLILCDKDVSEVFIPNKTGLLAENTAHHFAEQMQKLGNDSVLRQKLGREAARQASNFTEAEQIKKLESLYKDCIDQHEPNSYWPSFRS